MVLFKKATYYMEGFKSFTAKREGSILLKVKASGTPNNKAKQHLNQTTCKYFNDLLC